MNYPSQFFVALPPLNMNPCDFNKIKTPQNIHFESQTPINKDIPYHLTADDESLAIEMYIIL